MWDMVPFRKSGHILRIQITFSKTNREDASYRNLAVCLTYVDVKKISKFGAESVLYAGVTLALQYTLSGGFWRARVSMEYASHPKLAVCLTYVDVKKISKFGAESVLYAGVTLALQYTLSGGFWRARVVS